MIKSKTFRAWPRRKRRKNGAQIDEWRAYFSEDEIEALLDGTASDDLQRTRRAFLSYARDERKRVERVAAQKPKREPTAAEKRNWYPVRPKPGTAGTFLTLPRRVSMAVARYWFYAHALPRSEGKPALQRDTAIRALNLNDADAERWLPALSYNECKAMTRRVREDVHYPRCGIPVELAERIQVEPTMTWRREMSAEPPPHILTLVDPIHLSLGLSVWFYKNGRGQRAVYGWRPEDYAGGQAKVEAVAKDIVTDKADFRSQLLNIFD